MSEQRTSKNTRVMTPSNIITLIRICLVPLFVVVLLTPWPEWFGVGYFPNEWKSLLAACVFILISCTDWVDGYLARSRNEISDFGKFVDPLADKILVMAALLALVELDVLPSWPVLIILAREFIVAGVRMIAASRGEVIAASWYGKAKTVAQIVAIVLFLVKDSLYLPTFSSALGNPLYILSWIAMIIALVLTIVSMLDYLSKARHFLGFRSADEIEESVENADEDNVYLSDEEIHALAEKVVTHANSSRCSIVTAESLTGGMIAAALTAVPGSSAVVRGGIISYSNEIKQSVLGVDARLLAQEGAVNEQTVCEMVRGARKKLNANLGVAVSGIAGPSGAEPGKPVGTVWIAVGSEAGVRAEEYHFKGDRHEVRMQTVAAALSLLDTTL